MSIPTLPASLEPRFSQPDNLQFHDFKIRDGVGTMRVATALPENTEPKGTLLLLPGRTEFIEKFFETARDSLANGYAVLMLDWFGQGMSGRSIPAFPERCHATDFAETAQDLNELLASDLVAALPQPLHVLAHSMGANILLRTLANNPELPVDHAVLSAPFVGMIQTDIMPSWLTRLVLSQLGRKQEEYFFGNHNWSIRERSNPGRTMFSHDPARDSVHGAWMEANPGLRVAGMTRGWIRAAYQSCAELQKPETLQKIKTPILILQAEQDSIVSNRAQNHLVDHLPNARLLVIPHARHEILMEADPARKKAIDSIFNWIG